MEPKKMLQTQTNRKHTENLSITSEGIEFPSDLFVSPYGKKLNVTDGTIQEQTCRTINITFSQYACNAMQCTQCT
jgi:hypothetical protein